MKGLKVLSLFDGISCARVALERAGLKVNKYYASEIDKYAIQISLKNYPDIIQLGNVEHFEITEKDIDLLIGGSPCQDLSIAKKGREGLAGARSGLFYEFVRILKEAKPKYFILENVNSMPKEAKQTITNELFGIEPVMINAALVSAQNRKRLFWVGKLVNGNYEKVFVGQPTDRGILLKDILESEVDEKYFLNDSALKTLNRDSYGAKGSIAKENEKTKTLTASMGGGGGNGIYTTQRVGQIGKGGQGDRIYSPDGKSVNLSANGGGRGAKTGLYEMNNVIRKLTPIECERLQGLPDNYTGGGISNSQRYKVLGNAFNVDVVSFIINHLKF